MKDSKLFQSLETLSVYEINRFHKFILSPYFNVNKRMVLFFESIEPGLRNEDIDPPTKESIWDQFNPQKAYDDRKFRKYSSDLLKLFEQFLAQEAFESNPIHKAKYLLEAIASKRIDNLYNSSVKTAKRLSEMQYERPASFYFYQYEFERGFYNIVDYEINRSEVSNVERIVENLDRFYLAEKLRYYCTVQSRQNIRQHDYKILFMDEIIKHVEENDYLDVPPIQIYQQILKMNLEPNQREHYDVLRSLIHENILKFPELEAKEIIDSALNYSISQINKGKPEFLREIFELYQEGLSKELLYINEELSPWAFKNIVITALRLKEFEWAEQFIKEYQVKLNPSYRENALSFNLAQLYFYKKEYIKVIQLLQQVEYDDLSYNLNSKAFLMGSYYEMDDIEPMISLLDSFRVFLNRNKKIPTSRKTHYLNMINIVKKLAKIQFKDKVQIEKLRREIDDVKAIASKSWILEKLAELEA